MRHKSTMRSNPRSALPEPLQPLFRHLADGVPDVIQELKQAAGRAAGEQVGRGFFDPEGSSNRHVRVAVAPRL